jgi:general secretion pathway protein H
MPTSATGISNKHKPVRIRCNSAGLTLIELLVAVAVIGIIISITLLSLNVLGSDRQLQDEARRVVTLLEAAQDEALMQGREYGLEVMRTSYRFVEYDPYQVRWLAMSDDDIFRARNLPDGMEFELLLEDKLVSLKAEAAVIADSDATDVNASSKKYAPHIMIFSSGEATPFELRLAETSRQQVLFMEGDLLGNIDVLTADEQADAMR